MYLFRGIIKNKDNKVLFSKVGFFENEAACLHTLHKIVETKTTTQFDIAAEIRSNYLSHQEFIGNFENLKEIYKNPSQLKFDVKLV